MKKGVRSLLNKSIRPKPLFAPSPLNPSPSPMMIMDQQQQQQQQQQQEDERYSYNPKLHWNPQVEDYFIKAYGFDHFSRISNALTRPSSYSCIRVNTLKSTPDAVIDKLRAILLLNSQDSENKNGNLPMDIVKCDIPGMDYVVFVKGSGPHSIHYGYHPEKNPVKEVVVSRKCAEAVLRGAQVYVPGVLACSAHVEKGESVAVSVAIEQPGVDGGWGVGMTRGIVLQGDQTVFDMCGYLIVDPYHLERKGLYIGQGTTMLSRAGIFRVLKGLAVNMNNRVFNLPSFHGILEGEIFLQNLPSIVTAHVLDPQKGERILDMCAAPGGKTTAIALLMKDEGLVIANDRSHNKVLDIQKLAAEFGLKCISAYKLDALKAVCEKSECNQDMDASSQNQDMYVNDQSLNTVISQGDKVVGEGLNGHANSKENVTNETTNEKSYVSNAEMRKDMRRMKNGPGRNQTISRRVEKSKGFLASSFDRVLLDAPCSALGLRPRLFSAEETLESLRSHGKYQRRMLDQAVQLVRPGGVIVYSTCTLNPGENEALVRYALDTHKFLSLAPQHPRVGGPGLVGQHEFSDGYIEKWLKPGEEELVQRFDPSASTDTIGFFIAKFAVGPKE
ncbi:hypothetical protein ACFE04_003109 [Oxalis oulophora]